MTKLDCEVTARHETRIEKVVVTVDLVINLEVWAMLVVGVIWVCPSLNRDVVIKLVRLRVGRSAYQNAVLLNTADFSGFKA